MKVVCVSTFHALESRTNSYKLRGDWANQDHVNITLIYMYVLSMIISQPLFICFGDCLQAPQQNNFNSISKCHKEIVFTISVSNSIIHFCIEE